MLDLLVILELMQAVAAGQQLVDRLRPAQKHQTHQHQLRGHQFQRLVDALLPAVGATAHLQFGKTTPFERPQRLANLSK